MADKTGFEKFMSKQVGETVTIRPKSNTTPVARRTAAVENSIPEIEPVPVEQTPVKKHAGGRPRKDPSKEQKLVTLNFQIDEELKRILEDLKYRTHKSSVKGVVMEGIDLLLEKYGIER